jgi:hypothetical protein
MTTRVRALLTATVLAMATAACTHDIDKVPGNSTGGSRSRMEVAAPRECDTKSVPCKRGDVKAVAFARGAGPVFVGLGTPVRRALHSRHEGTQRVVLLHNVVGDRAVL